MPSFYQTNPSLALATRLLTYYGYSFMLIFGNIGNLLNIVLFMQKKLRQTSCNNYFLVTAFSNLIALNVGISSVLFAESDPFGMTTIQCKIESYVMNISLQTSRFMIVVASFDRYALCSTNASLRRFARVRIARRYIIPLLLLIILFVPIHVPILVSAHSGGCVYAGTAAIYNSIYSLALIGILPPGLMFLFSVLIFRNLKSRQDRRRVHPAAPQAPGLLTIENQRLRKKDQQVFAMLLVQVCAYVLSSTPYTITIFYVVLRTITVADEPPEQKSTITFIQFLTDMLRFVCPFISFYLFLAVSRLYRREMMIVLRRVSGRFAGLCTRQTNALQETTLTR